MPKKKLTKAQEKKDIKRLLNTINRLIENKLYYPHDMNTRVSLKGLLECWHLLNEHYHIQCRTPRLVQRYPNH
jgi:hypothetical protein